MTQAPTKQYFTEQEAMALKRKLVRAKTRDLSVAIGTFGKITMVDNFGTGYDREDKPIPVWEVGIKWDSDDEDEEPIYDWFDDKATFSEHVELVSKEQYSRGNVFTEEEATALIGKRVRATTTYNSGLLKKGVEGTVTGISKDTTWKGSDTWQVEITWDTTTENYLRQFPRTWFYRDIEMVEATK